VGRRPEEHSDGQQNEKQQPAHIGIALLMRGGTTNRLGVLLPQSVNLDLPFWAAKWCVRAGFPNGVIKNDKRQKNGTVRSETHLADPEKGTEKK
jgi:hypothetical protein